MINSPMDGAMKTHDGSIASISLNEAPAEFVAPWQGSLRSGAAEELFAVAFAAVGEEAEE